MTASKSMANVDSFTALRQFARKRTQAERCEMCGLEVSPDHQHLIDLETRRLICACEACAILFGGQSSLKFKRVPRRVRWLGDFRLTDGQWDSLMIPIEMVFIFRNSRMGKMLAFYPSPAGAIESLLSLDTWSEIERDNPGLSDMEPDVEALLVNRVGAQRGVKPEFFAVPIDECYKLAGLIRMYWRGLSGGTEVWREVGTFFEELKGKAGALAEGQNA